MIYVCVTSRDNASTIGLLLWKVRQVFLVFPREYQLLVADDASSDGTSELLERYARVLPLTVVTRPQPGGYAACAESLLRVALDATDRPKRDAALMIPSDFAVSPEVIPDMIRRVESGADVVIGERQGPETSFGAALIRRSAPWLLRPGLRIPGVRDLLSGCCALRLSTLKQALSDETHLLESDGACARAELVARAVTQARRISVVELPATQAVPVRDRTALALALELYRAGRRLRIPSNPGVEWVGNGPRTERRAS
ncbi:MAG TPA: glycosyltransferase [Gemmatimonadales bacterium]